MTTIGSIGIGLFILIIVWILALIIFVFAVRAQSNFGWVALGVAALVTVVLISIPTQKANRQEEFQTEEKDYSQIFRNILLAFLTACVIVGAVSVLIFYCIEPIHPKQIKTF